jgi:hypothetical protein
VLSAARPGRSSEITTARYNKLVERLRAVELGAVGDLGFVGLDDDPDNPAVITGYKAARTIELHRPEVDDGTRTRNRQIN